MESYHYCKDFVYKKAHLNEELSEEYKRDAWVLVKKRIAMAGYRLSDMLQLIYKKYKSKHSNDKDSSKFLE